MGLDDQITEHFKLREFLWSQHCHRHAGLPTHPNIHGAQMKSIQHLADQLEVIRSWYGKPVKILSGVRDAAIQAQLLADGIRSSSITDHAYFNPDVWAWGVGAVDFQVATIPHETVMNDLRRRQDSVAFSYAIVYSWGLHLSAPADMVLNVRPSRPRFERDQNGVKVAF